MLSCSLVQTIGSSEIYFKVFFFFFFYRGTCISDVHTRAYPISVLYTETDDFFSRMNDCDVLSSLTLTAYAVMRFGHGVDTRD